MIFADGWSTAQEPRFVAGPAHALTRVAARQKSQEAAALRAAVEAHMRSGGEYIVLTGSPTPSAPRRVLGE